MNRTKRKYLIIGIAFLVLQLLLTLYLTGKISHNLVVIVGLLLIVGIAVIYHFMKPDDTEVDEQQLRREFKKIKVQRTREGNLFEMATAMILALSLFLGFITHTFEQRSGILEGYIFSFIGAIAALAMAYHPMRPSATISPSKRITNVEQFKLMIRNYRVEAILLALMALNFSISPEKNHLQTSIFICLLIAMVVVPIVFSFLNKKNK